MQSKLALRLVVALLPIAAYADQAIDLADVSGPETWGGVDNVVQLRHLYFSAQPDAAALEAARNRGVSVIVNLREPGELDWDERAAAERLGLVYYNVPIRKSSETLSGEALSRIDAIVGDHRDGQILLHCSSGNRASAWLVTHLVEDHGMNVDDALPVARKTGLTTAGMENRVKTYLGERQPEAPDEAEEEPRP